MEGKTQEIFTGERALFFAKDMEIIDSTFCDGESPLKHSQNIQLEGCSFKWKYPLWYAKDIHVENSTWFEMARSGVWYTNNITIENSMIDAPKNFRRCQNVTLNHVRFSNASETFWNCRGINLKDVTAKGDYFAMNSEDITIDGLELFGNYSFDGAKNITITNSKLLSKDSFWNSENVIVKDSYICGEYIGWNSKNVTFINCTIESLQGFCYIKELKLENCKLLNTTLAFEYCDVDADVTNTIDSILNPSSGTIRAKAIKEVILEENRIDPSATTIQVENDHV